MSCMMQLHSLSGEILNMKQIENNDFKKTPKQQFGPDTNLHKKMNFLMTLIKLESDLLVIKYLVVFEQKNLIHK